MIVRDEEKNISNCLGSVHGIFDEIVVVDTGSKDQTVEIARSFGARIFEFPWIDDFAAARNEALSHATGAYAFWLDADDVVEPTEREKLRALLATLERPAGACMGSGDLAVGHSGGVARAEPSAADAGVVLRAAKRGCEGNETFGQALGRGQEIRAQRGAGADRRSGPVDGVGRVALPLPPNRACGSPAHGFPVDGLTSKRIDELARVLFSSYTVHAR
jgi:glycosyltransferase involved in cell wall biosynthesis